MIATNRFLGKRISGWMYPALALLLMFPALKAFAQYENGSLVGTIHDASGAAVPGVTVTVTNDATGVAEVVKTNESGDYEIPSLRVGVYNISASASRFRPCGCKEHHRLGRRARRASTWS